MVTSGTFSWCLWEVRNTVVLGGSSRDSTWVSALEDVSSRVEAETSVFLSCSDVSLRVCMPFQTGSQVSTCVEAWNSVFLSSCQRGFRPLGEMNLGPGVIFKLATRTSELTLGYELILGFRLKKYTHPRTTSEQDRNRTGPFMLWLFQRKPTFPHGTQKGT